MEKKIMVSACILICCEPRKYTEVAKMIKGVKGVYLPAAGGMRSLSVRAK
jgi:hypothetical protein